MKPHTAPIQHTAEFSSRRRALFPSDENHSDSDLGCISPLNFDSDRENSPNFSLLPGKCVGDYDIIGLVDDKSGPLTPLGCITNKICTPCQTVDESPTQKLKTPHEFSAGSKLPKLARKAAVSPPISESKESKVRTALFPDMSLPPKSFYPNKPDRGAAPRGPVANRETSPRRASTKPNFYLCKRSRFRSSGQINAGVRHGIRKTRKPKKISKIAALIENSPKMSPQKGVKRPRRPSENDDDFEGDKGGPFLPPGAVSGIIEALGGDKEDDVLMSPTSQMCNMTSGLVLSSPKANKNLNAVLDQMGAPQQQKYFPVFYPGATVAPTKRNESPKQPPTKKFRALSKDQMLLDAGQKKWGATQCPECKIIYHQGDPGDEIMHLNYHNAGHIFRFNGWKNERVVSDLADGKIVQIAPGDSKIWWKKVKDVMEVVNRDLGFYDIEFKTLNSQIFFYIKNRIIIGALVAEVKTIGYKLLTTAEDTVDLCSEESYPIKCGVSRIWVSQNSRKKGVGTALMNSLKRNFAFGSILRNEDIAFSSPTEMGKIFGKNYFKTPNFLIYFC